MENKAGLTGQTVPGRRIPGHWPYPGPEELAEAEPVGPDSSLVWTFPFLLITASGSALASFKQEEPPRLSAAGGAHESRRSRFQSVPRPKNLSNTDTTKTKRRDT